MTIAADGVGGFGALLQRHRQTAGLSQEELAERAGLSVRGISDLERGARQAPYPDTVRRLAEALGLEPSERAALVSAARRTDPAARSAAGGPRLPVGLTSFVGRERDLAELRSRLRTARLLTLTGPGGVGKTRLALELARQRARDNGGPVAFVELAALAETRQVPWAVASTLGIPEQPGRAPLADALAGRQLLLVLDNCEHLVAACAELSEALLGACADLQILATSRERLEVAGETTWRVPPLTLPGQDEPSPPVEELARSEAVQLFAERARAALPEFILTDQNAAGIAELCRRLDGMPLALELAAARVPLLGVAGLAARVDDRFRLLVGGSRTAHARQQTLRATVAWSYDLLAEPEQRLFERLSVFAGSWSLEAAEVVAADEYVRAAEVLNLLGRLVDKSLVVAEPEPSGSVRYRQLETLRQFAREQLATADVIRDRHAQFYLGLVEKTTADYHGPHERRAFDRLEREQDNLRVALRWLIERGEAERADRLAGALWWFWIRRRDLAEGRSWLEQVAASPRPGPSQPRAQVLFALASIAWQQGDFARAQAAAQEALGIAQQLGEQHLVGRIVGLLGILALVRGDDAAARAFLTEGLGLARRVGDRWNEGRRLEVLAVLALRDGQRELARDLLNQAAALGRASGDDWSLAMTLTVSGDLARTEGDYGEAGLFYEEALARYEASGHPRPATSLLHNLAYVALRHGDTARSEALFREGLVQFQEVGEQRGIAECLVGLAGVAAAAGTFDRSARLFGAAEALLERLGAQLSPSNRADYERSLAGLGAAVETQAFRTAWMSGRHLSLGEAVACGLEPLPQA